MSPGTGSFFPVLKTSSNPTPGSCPLALTLTKLAVLTLQVNLSPVWPTSTVLLGVISVRLYRSL